MFIIYIIILILFISLFFFSKYININIKNHYQIKTFIEKNIFLVSFIIIFLFIFFFNIIRLKKQKNKRKEIQKNIQEDSELLIQEQVKNYIKTQKEQLVKQPQYPQSYNQQSQYPQSYNQQPQKEQLVKQPQYPQSYNQQQQYPQSYNQQPQKEQLIKQPQYPQSYNQQPQYPQSYNTYTWKNELENWKRGIIPFNNINKENIYLICSPIINYNLTNSFFNYIIKDGSPRTDFNNGINDFSNDDLIKNNKPNDFWNLDESSILIIPPYEYDTNGNIKNFANIYQFQKNASNEIKKQFWTYVANVIIKICKEKKYKDIQLNNNLYINTHGGGVPYFHLRIDLDRYIHHDLQ
jgi:hypothetical protein